MSGLVQEFKGDGWVKIPLLKKAMSLLLLNMTERVAYCRNEGRDEMGGGEGGRRLALRLWRGVECLLRKAASMSLEANLGDIKGPRSPSTD